MSRSIIVPVFLFLSVLLGGSGQGVWNNAALQLCAIALLAWAMMRKPAPERAPVGRGLWILLGAGMALAILQLIPLPVAMWTMLPMRGVIADGFRDLGYALPAMPVSLAPYAGVAALAALLPAVAVLAATTRTRQRGSWIAVAILGATLASVCIGAAQAAGGGPTKSPFYFYDFTNVGAVGFFANANHFGALLLISIPFTIASISAGSGSRKRQSAAVVLGSATLVIILIGIALNRSIAAFALTIPVLLASALIVPRLWGLSRRWILSGLLVLGAGALLLVATGLSERLGTQTSVNSRSEIWNRTSALVAQNFPVGTGLGSFETVYPLTESASEVGTVYVNHAHNDYLELALELGLAGILLILAFLGWWSVQAVRVWRSPLSSNVVKAATIASGTLLVWSMVDYPLRTGALSSIFACCIALMAMSRNAASPQGSSAPAAKHVVIG